METAQDRLSALRARRAKAEALGREAIRKAQAVYDDICAEIERLEIQLCIAPMDALTALMDDILALEWPQNDWYALCKQYDPPLLHEIDGLEKAMATALDIQMLRPYRTAMLRLREIVNTPVEELERKGAEADEMWKHIEEYGIG